MTDITELAQRMKAAAEKLDADQWQTRKGFSGIEVIVKGSLEKGHGCVSFQPVAADMADTKTARAIALFSPANVLALVEALEKAQQQMTESENRVRKQNRHICELFDDNTALRQRIAELESRTVTFKLPFTPEPSAFAPWAAKAFYQFHKDTVKSCVAVFSDACAAAGIKVEAE
ncbi:hypothetical protein B6I43_06490 [Klebsiella pneumoniae]|nr:ead/Ea22-like family protein [Klebsiella pneumoniae]PLC89029.1 hypothetical protein B6I43_06490 [Klebsiella pneumoniae]